MNIATGGADNFLLSAADVQQIEGAGGSAIPTNPPQGKDSICFGIKLLLYLNR